MFIKDMFRTLRLLALGAASALLSLHLKASNKLPQGIDACIKINDMHKSAHRYTDILRRFMPGETLENGLINYLSDLGYPDFEDLREGTALGFFLSSKEETAPLRLAFIAVQLDAEGALRESLQKKGWLLYDYKEWTFISLASLELFENAVFKDAWIDYLNHPAAQDLEASLSLSGLEEELEGFWGHALGAIPAGALPTNSQLKRPLFQAVKKELGSVDAMGIACRYLEAEDRLELQEWLQAKPGSALESFLSQDLGPENPIETITSSASPLKIGVHLQPQALKAYASYLQAVCYSLGSFDNSAEDTKGDTFSLSGATEKTPSKLEKMLEALPAYSQRNLAEKGSSALGILIHSLESFEQIWDGNSLLGLSFGPGHKHPEAILPYFTLMHSGTFSQADLFEIGQDQVRYVPSFLKGLRPDDNLAIQSKLTPEAFKIGECSFNTLEFQIDTLGSFREGEPKDIQEPAVLQEAPAHVPLQGFTLYSGVCHGYAIFANTQDSLETTLAAIDKAAAPNEADLTLPAEGTLALAEAILPIVPEVPVQSHPMLWLNLDLLACYPPESVLMGSSVNAEEFLLRGDVSLKEKTVCLTVFLPLKALDVLLQGFKSGPFKPQDLGPSVLNTPSVDEALAAEIP
jgi:hypothetical protein